jgi:hypothetical protein
VALRDMDIASLCEFDENDRFFTTSFDPSMGHTFRLSYTFHPKKDTKDSFKGKSIK